MQLWASRLLSTDLVALAVVDEAAPHPATRRATLPTAARVVDEATAALVEAQLGVESTTHVDQARARPVWADLDALIARAEHARRRPL